MAFSIATWNVLATAYIRKEYYPRTPPEFLDPSWRVPALVRRAQELQADILCLQELERTVFAVLEQAFDAKGYRGVYAPKSGRKPDGCATFVHADIRLVTAERIAFSDGGGGANSGHIAQFLYLEQAGKPLVVVNTHLKWDSPGTPRDRQWSYRQMSEILKTLRTARAAEAGQIICGDFNVKTDGDAVAALLAAGFDYAHRGLDVHTFNSDRDPRLIDYIFHNAFLRAEPLRPAQIDAETTLPSPEHPSDHLPLIARMEWTALLS